MSAPLRTPHQIQAELDAVKADVRAMKDSALNRAALAAQTPIGASNREITREYQIDDAEFNDLAPGGDTRHQRSGNTLIVGGVDKLTGEYRRGILDAQQPASEWHASLLRAIQARTLTRLGQIARQRTVATPRLDERIARLAARAPDGIRADLVRAFDGSTGAGAEWRETRIVPQLEYALVSARTLANNFDRFNAPSRDFKIPFMNRDAVPYLTSGATGDTPGQIPASTPSTEERSRSIVNLSARVVLSEDTAEDVIFNAMSEVEAAILRAMVDGIEDAIMNGDTAGTHQDAIASWTARGRWPTSGMGGSMDHRRAWIGLRARAYDVSNTADGATVTYATIMAARAALSGAQSAGRVVLICSPEVYVKHLMTLAEVATLDKMGPRATVLSGQVASIGGMPIIVSDFMTADLASTGLFTATGATSGYVIANLDRFRVYDWRNLTMESDKDISRQAWQVVATTRQLFTTIDDATAKNVSYRFNLA